MRIKNIQNELQDLNVKDLIKQVLTNKPNTRNSDTLLFVECSKELGAKTVEDIMFTGLNVQSVVRLRRMIQASDTSLLPTLEVRQARSTREAQAIDYFRTPCS